MYVRKHSTFQGMKGKPLRHDVKCMIADLQLEDKTNVAVKKLSGGMKRKLRFTHS